MDEMALASVPEDEMPTSSTRTRDDIVREIEDAFATGEFAAAMRLCEDLIDDDADDADAVALHAWASIRGGDANRDELQGALVKLERAVSLDRTSDRAIYHRGLVHKRLGNTPLAVRDFARAIQINPRNIPAEREITTFAQRVRKEPSQPKLAVAPVVAPPVTPANDDE